MEDYLKFLHLSDIHFRNKLKNYDFDSELRGELENDLDRIISEFKEINGILITGDLVFSGKEEEYKEIRNWIEKIAHKIHCSFENIWLVPGNHDIDRDVILKSTFIQDIHKNLRKCKNQQKIDRKLENYVIDRDKNLLVESLTNYNRFAVSFGCETKPEQFFWETTEKSDYKLNDGSVLRLRGMNSVLVSNEKDDEDYRFKFGFESIFYRKKKRRYIFNLVSSSS